MPEGKSINVLLNIMRRRDAVGNVLRVVGIKQDFTELKVAEAAAKAPILDVDAGGLITNQRERVRSVLSDALQGENTWNETATPEEPEDEHKESEGQLEREELGTAIRLRMIMAAAPRRTEEETGDAGNKTDADEEEDVEHIEDGKGGSEEKGVTLSRKQRELGKEGASAGGEELRGREEIHSRRVWNPTWAEIAARPIPSIPLIPTGSTANPGEKDSGPPRGCQLPVLKRPTPGRRLHEPVTTRAPTNAVPWPKVKTFSKVLPADASGTRLPSIRLGLNLRPVDASCQNLLLRAVLSAVGLCLQLLRIHLGLYLHHVESSCQNFLNSTAS